MTSEQAAQDQQAILTDRLKTLEDHLEGVAKEEVKLRPTSHAVVLFL